MIASANIEISRVKGIGELPLSFLILVQCLLFVFESYVSNFNILSYAQFAIDCVFLIDLLIKIKLLGRGFFRKPLNIFDSIVVFISFAFHLVMENSNTITVLRVVRLLRLFKLLSFVPNVEHIIKGIGRALRASRGVFLMLSILVIFFSILGYLLFKNSIPSHFSDPILSSYTVFSLFTVEGWNEIPSLVSPNSIEHYLIRAYVITVIVCGSFFALSLANAIFIDEMVMDNNDDVEVKIRELTSLVEKQSNQLEDLKRLIIEQRDR
ncbi:ion transporter [Vibrio fluvialis]|uniref:ion transporter n=1 Tax=Vibrio fluvialis TaxID=676 RepID=UPI001C9BE95A|nr:ion transporter [Vibrio fluvialis]ELD1800110.1 ion transporter [Vibrio fluvialis]ELO1781099.1 ion transporter [Vibrio fluvialis]MBY7937963.1 ion transporter [Vibrio fluvialis]MCE7582425.1 ion transporter [Vibrio fluvialis]